MSPSKFARFRALSWSERRVLILAMLLLPLFHIGLRILGLPRLLAWIARSPAFGRGSHSREDLATIGALVDIAGNHGPFPATCLTRSLLLHWLLRCRGVDSDLRIGVRFSAGKLEAHAWLEHAGEPLNDQQDIAAQFAPFHGPLSRRLVP
jgi:hypothetical protein